MTARSTLSGFVLVGMSLLFGAAGPDVQEQAAASFDEGRALLAQADFEGAAAAFATAAKADPQNQAYRNQYALIRRVMILRDAMEREQDNARWDAMARAIRSFYYDNAVYGEALSLDRQRHVRIGGLESATLLAETQLELDMNDETVSLLDRFEREEQTPRSRTLLGIALARLERLDEAAPIARACALPDGVDPALCFDLARLHCLLGEQEAASRALTRCFRTTLPSRLEAAKQRAEAHPDLRALASSAGFAAVLSTSSQISESSCSGGAGCGSCPSRSTCGGEAEKGGS
ncbi:MAG: hypothetical protein SYC29_11445 [Planctomycetota bacterium]|nr:hypothetical protein [Planctomycetota bacterium]